LKITQKNLTYEDFKLNFIDLSNDSSSVSRIIDILKKKAKIIDDSSYLIKSIEGKDFLFGRLYKV
jgi:hypothetical protein